MAHINQWRNRINGEGTVMGRPTTQWDEESAPQIVGGHDHLLPRRGFTSTGTSGGPISGLARRFVRRLSRYLVGGDIPDSRPSGSATRRSQVLTVMLCFFALSLRILVPAGASQTASM
jgi:hypothetical protein